MSERVHRVRRHAVRGTVSVALVLALAGLMFTANARLAQSQENRHSQDLEGLAERESARVEQLGTRIDSLRVDVERLTENATRAVDTGDPGESALVALAAGRAAVTGPGLTVTLTDAPAEASQRDDVQPDDLVVHQQDLQAVVNALWAGGAEAMALQDQRVTATSAFRCVGNVLFLGGRVYSPPYVVRAIGDTRAMRAALAADPTIQRYLGWVDLVGLGWSVTADDALELPAAESGADLTYARVPDGVDVFPGGDRAGDVPPSTADVTASGAGANDATATEADVGGPGAGGR